jgi:hypothetical protein
MTRRITEMSPRFLARMAAVLGILEGAASVSGQLRIPGRLVVDTDASATAANILGNESLFRLGVALCLLAVVFNTARTVLSYVLFRPVGRIVALLIAFFGLVTIGLQASGSLVQLPVLVLLKSGKDFAAFNAEQLQSISLLFLRWSGHTFNLYLAFFGLCCILVGYAVYKSTFLPRILGVLEMAAGVGYATYFWPPLASYLSPYNLALGVGELALGFWLLVFGVNVEPWKEQAGPVEV